MTILEIIQEAAIRCKQPDITNIGSNDNQSKMFLGSANKMAREIIEEFDWGNTRKEGTFTTVVAQQEYDVPSDFKYISTDNLYNNTRQWAIPRETDDMALYYVASGNQSWTNTKFRILNDQFVFTIPADSADVITYVYKSKNISKLSDGAGGYTYAEKFSNNSEEFLLDDEMLIRAIVFDIQQQVGGTDAARLQAEYIKRLAKEKNRDGGKFIITQRYDAKKYPYPRNWNLVNNGDC